MQTFARAAYSVEELHTTIIKQSITAAALQIRKKDK